MSTLRIGVLSSMMLFCLLGLAQADSLTTAGMARLQDTNHDNFSENLQFLATSHFLQSVDPSDDPLADYAGGPDPAWCYMPRSRVEFTSLKLVSDDAKCHECTEGSFPLQEGTYKAGMKLYLLQGTPVGAKGGCTSDDDKCHDACRCDDCRYEPVLTLDVLIRLNTLNTNCDDASFSFCYVNPQVNNLVGSPLLEAFAAAEENRINCGYGTLDGDQDLATLIRRGLAALLRHEMTFSPPCETGGCADCGLESNGRMAAQLAKRYYLRGQSAVCSNPSGEGMPCEQVMPVAPAPPESSGYPNLAEIVLDFAELNLNAVPSTPADLPMITNATDVLAYDHFTKDGLVNGAVLMLQTENAVYEHSKAICDRASGRKLEQISWITENGMIFPVAVLRNEENGTREVAVSLSGVAKYHGLELYSRWGLGEYPDVDGYRVYTMQLWSGSLEETHRLLKAQLAKLEAEFESVIYDRSPKPLSDAFFTHGYKMGRALRMNLNTDDVAGLTLSGRYWPEGDAQNPLSFSVPITRPSDLDLTLNNALDVELSLTTPNGRVLDSLYLSDGSFTAFNDSTFDGQSEVTHSVNENCGRESGNNVMALPLTGCASMEGQVDRYATIVRTIGGRAAPLNVHEHPLVTFRYKSNQLVVMCLESKRRAGLSQACVHLPKQSTWRSMEVPLEDFAYLGGETETPQLDDIVAVSWNLWNPEPDKGLIEANMAVESLAFYSVEPTEDPEPEEEPAYTEKSNQSSSSETADDTSNWVRSGCSQQGDLPLTSLLMAILMGLALALWRMRTLSKAMRREHVRLHPWQRGDRN